MIEWFSFFKNSSSSSRGTKTVTVFDSDHDKITQVIRPLDGNLYWVGASENTMKPGELIYMVFYRSGETVGISKSEKQAKKWAERANKKVEKALLKGKDLPDAIIYTPITTIGSKTVSDHFGEQDYETRLKQENLTTVFDRCDRPELSALAERDHNAKLHQQERDSFPRPLNPSMIQKIRQQIRNGEEIPDKGFQKTWGDDEK